MCKSAAAGTISVMASRFEMDPASANSGLSGADAAAAAESTSGSARPSVMGYAAPLKGAVQGVLAVRRADKQIRVAANVVSREASVAEVDAAEAANAGRLST